MLHFAKSKKFCMDDTVNLVSFYPLEECSGQAEIDKDHTLPDGVCLLHAKHRHQSYVCCIMYKEKKKLVHFSENESCTPFDLQGG